LSEAGPRERWTVLGLILWSGRYLTEKGVEQGRLDAEHLLAHALGVGRLQLYLQHDRPLGPEELSAFKPLLRRRASREPLQYILGRVGFRELELRADRRGLIPRPETEVLVDVVLAWARKRAASGARLRGADVGTGTGCIALSLAMEGPFDRVIATDRSDAALELAAENARDAGLEDKVEFRLGSFLEPLAGERLDALVSNPPYVADADRAGLQAEVRDWEPEAALFAGPDGLTMIRNLVSGAAALLLPGGILALEVGAGQARPVAELVQATGAFDPPRIHRDLAGHERIVTATLGA